MLKKIHIDDLFRGFPYLNQFNQKHLTCIYILYILKNR
jgi:hypothetical protein